MGGRPLSYVDPNGLVAIPTLIPNFKVIAFVRDRAKNLGYDLSKCTDKDILGFVNFVPESTATNFGDIWESRHDHPRSQEEKRKEAAAVAKLRLILDTVLKDWVASKKAKGENCDCVLK